MKSCPAKKKGDPLWLMVGYRDLYIGMISYANVKIPMNQPGFHGSFRTSEVPTMRVLDANSSRVEFTCKAVEVHSGKINIAGWNILHL